MRSSPNDRSRIQADREESSLFGFELSGVDWLERVLDFVEPDSLDSIGLYEEVEEVSRGGQGIIYRARQPGTGRQVALKRMLAGSLSTGAARARLQREAEAAASLSHPGIVTVYGLEEVDGLPVYAMEWIEGEPITAWARREGRTPDEILRAFLQVCDAVRHAHQRGVLHRDLKPSNVLVDREGRPRVLDFGLAKRVTEGAADATRTQGFVGTPAYAAPEQIEGKNELVDARSDVYSLGVVLYEMLTGERPYRPEDGMLAFAEALQHERFARPSALRSGLAREIDSIVATAIAAEPDERYQSVDALASDIGRFLAHEPVEAHGSSSWYALAKMARRHRAVFALSLLLAVTALGSAIFFAVQAARLADKRDEALEAREAEEIARRDADALARAERAAREEAEQAGEALALQVEAAELAREQAMEENVRAERIIVFMLDDVIGSAAETPNLTIREAVDQAAPWISRRFSHDAMAEGYMRVSLARMYEAMREYTRACGELERAIELFDANDRPNEAARARSFLSGIQGESPEGVEQVLATLRQREAALSGHGGDVTGIFHLRMDAIRQLLMLGTPDALAEAEREILSTHELLKRNNVMEEYYLSLHAVLAGVLDRTNRPDDAELLRRKMLDRYRELSSGRLDQDAADLLIYLFVPAMRRQDYAEAESLVAEALRVYGEEHPLFADAQARRAQALYELGRVEESVAVARSAWESVQRTPNFAPDRLASIETILGIALLMAGDTAEAIGHLQAAVETCEEAYGPDSPRTFSAKGSLGIGLFHAERLQECLGLLSAGLEDRDAPSSPARNQSVDRMFRRLLAAILRVGDRDDIESAFELRQRSALLAPEKARVHLDHARVLREIVADEEGARLLEEQARELDPAMVEEWERDPPALRPWELDPSDPLTKAYEGR